MHRWFEHTFIDRVRASARIRRVRTWLKTHPRTAVSVVGGVLCVLGVVLILVPDRPAASDPGSSTRPVASEAPRSARPSGTTPDEVPGGWSALDLPQHEPVALLTMDGAARVRVDPSATFTLRSLTETPAIELAERITVDPTTELTVEAGDTADLAAVRPTSPLTENVVYRFRLTDQTGALLEEWTFRTAGPLRVVRWMPETETTQVPTDTGIEFEFDRDGVTDISDHFTIEPLADGRFERHGRTWVFVPTSGLEPSTLYTVTLSAGLEVEGTGERLDQDIRLAFETAGDRGAIPPSVAFHRSLFEVRPGAASVVPVRIQGEVGQAESMTRSATLFALDSASAAMDAAMDLAVDRSWAARSSNGGVVTDSLREAATFEAAVHTRGGEQRLEIPIPLQPGFYLLEVEQVGRRAQVVLQVSDVAAYVATSDTSMVAWVNDLGSETPIEGATVSLPDGTRLGQTDAAGLLRAAAADPPVAQAGPDEDARRFVLVSAPGSGQIITAINSSSSSWFFGPRAASDQWWLQLGTDRLMYRQDDTIQVWGFVKARADRAVPGSLELRLVAGWDPAAPAVSRTPVEATERGTLVGELPVEGLPPGQYTVALFTAGDSVASTMVTVADIRKPLFAIDLETDRHAYITGEAVAAEVRASFFDGTSAPGLQLRVSGSGVTPDGDRTVTLGADGTGELAFDAAGSMPSLETGTITAGVATPEEGMSYDDASFAVFSSSAWLEGHATVVGGTLTVEGRVTRVDLAAADAQQATDGTIHDPSGDPLGGRTISAAVDRVTWLRVQDGSSYNFLEKRVVPTYRYDRHVERIGTFSPVSAADGSYELSLPFDANDATAEVTLRITDEEGRAMQLTVWSSADAQPMGGRAGDFPYLERPVTCGGRASVPARIGEPFEVTMRAAGGRPSADGATLFLLGRAGIDEVLVTTEAGIERVFEDADLPSLGVRAVRLTDTGYIVTDEVVVQVEEGQKAIELVLAADRQRYMPGDDVTVTIRATGADGRPIASDVVVQAVDAKLYAMGAAQSVSVGGLMAPTSTGFTGAYATHEVEPPEWELGCGATTGGPDMRDDFKDNATFQLVRTGTDGRGQVTFEVPDDLTSWVVTATAFSDALDAGTTTLEVPVSLPFFVEATIAPEYLAGEEPTIHLRAFGDALAAGDAVTFTVEAASLGLDETRVAGRAFEPARLELPALALGDHELIVTATGPGDVGDAITRTIRVVPTRLRTLQHAYDTVNGTFEPPGGDGMTTYVVTDAGRGAVVPVLQLLSSSDSARLDAMLAAELAGSMLIEDFGMPEASVPPSGYRGLQARLAEGGLALLPHTSGDLFLTARTALVAPDELPSDYAVSVLSEVLESDPPRERAIVALAGLAGMGRDVRSELVAFDAEELSLRERLWLALGLAAVGETETARAIERSILAQHGQRLDGWVRLAGGTDTPETAETTASMLLLAAALRDPIAVDISRYLLDNPSHEYLPVIEQLGYARAAMQWLPRTPARFVWSMDGEEQELTLGPAESLTLTLTARQRESFTLDPIDGAVLVASSWLGAADYDDLPRDGSVAIERTVSPGDHAPADKLVRVRITVRFPEPLDDGCYQVTDLVPSGLSPVVEAGIASPDSGVISPYEVEGQRVSWCVGSEQTSVTLGYAARVVSAGTYRWEPAIIQAVGAPSIGSATAVVTYTVD